MKFILKQLSHADLDKAITKALGRRVDFVSDGTPMVTAPDGRTSGGFVVDVVSQLSDADVLAIQPVLAAHEVIDWVLAVAKTKAKDNIDRYAEEVRAKYLTSAPLQTATYISKAKDALNYKAAGYPVPFVPTTYPYVDAEMRAAGDASAQAAADRIIGESNLFDAAIGSAIEYERRRAKINIDSAACSTVDLVATEEANAKALLSVI